MPEPDQQTYGEQWDQLHATLFEKEKKSPKIRKLSELTDFVFLEAKCTHVAVITSGKGESAKRIYGGVYYRKTTTARSRSSRRKVLEFSFTLLRFTIKELKLDEL